MILLENQKIKPKPERSGTERSVSNTRVGTSRISLISGHRINSRSSKMSAATVLPADALPVIDLRLFTQSELRALSESSGSSVFDLASRFGGEDDVPVPKIDRAVFNESAGSRKQTYSRLRLAPRKPEVVKTGGFRVGEVRGKKEDEVDDLENRRIVGMLKELVGEGSEEAEVFEGLVGVEIECDPELDLADVVLVRQEVKVEVGAVSPVRRKRGRPRKDSDVMSVSVSVSRIVVCDSEGVGEFGGENLKKNGNEVEDMEMVNKNGVVVDLVALRNADDPFGPEMRRRTEGMSTKEQLLEFLNGLDGKWVSRRRKRKIVDASFFGDVLPKGWKLLFSIKKKSGHAWLICRRYISPSGREFISCKEVSSFLQQLSGMQSEEQVNTICNDENIMPVESISAEKIPAENVALHVGNQVVHDDVISNQHPSMSLIPNLATQVQPEKISAENVALHVRNQVVHDNVISKQHPAMSLIPNLATQVQPESQISLSDVTKNDGSPHILPPENVVLHVGNQVVHDDGVISNQHPSMSLIPNLATQVQPERQISLSDVTKNDGSRHILPPSPKSKSKRRKLGSLVSDGVIITNGKFECQFCHKVFDERRRYNGHVGVHVRNVEAQRGSGKKSAGTDLSSVSGGVFLVASGLDATATSCSGAQENQNDGTWNDAVELGSLHTNLVGGSEVGGHSGKSNIEISQVDAEVNQKVIDEAVFEKSNDDPDRKYKMAEDVVGKVDTSVCFGAEMSHCVAPQATFVENGLLEPSEVSRISMSDVKTVGEDGNSEKSTVVYNIVGKQSEGDEKSNGDSASFGEKMIADVENIQPAECADTTFNGENNDVGLVSNENKEHTIDFTEQFGNERSPFNLGMVDNEQEDVCAFYQQRSIGSSPPAPVLEQRHSSINFENEAVASRLVEYKENVPEKDHPILVRNQQALTVSNDFLDGISGHSSTPCFMHPSNSGIQPTVVSSSNNATLGGNDWPRDMPQKIFGVTHLFPSLNQDMGTNDARTTSTDVNSKSPWKIPFNPQDSIASVDRAPNVMGSKEFWKAIDVPTNTVAKTGNEAMLNRAVVPLFGQGKVSGGYPFSSFGNEQGFNIRSDMVGMSDNSMQESRLERDYVSDLINPFADGQSNQANSKLFPTRPIEQSRGDEVRFPLNSELQISLGNDQSRLDALNRNLKGQSLVLSGNEQFDLRSNSNAFYNSSVDDSRDQRAHGSGLMSQFGQQDMFGLQNNLNQAYNDSMWGGEQRRTVGNYGTNGPMTGFGSNQPQRSENVLTEGGWSVGANAHGFVDLSLSRSQPSGYMHNLQMMASKGDDQYFGGVQKINNNPVGFQDQRGGIQQREYNFLNAHAKPYPQDTNTLPYGQQMQQSYDPASWLGRQAPFPQVPARNPPTASCVWCSNMFYLENSFSQADTIVPACPSCKTQMTEQLHLS